MSRFDPNTTFGDDRRAVTAVLGLILIFAILVLTLTIYQAQIVPQQNAQVEFQHYQDVQNDLIQLRNSISTAGQADTSQFTRVMLGTTYQTRVATINPVDPAGTLRTSDEYNITVDNGDISKNVSTRFLEYEPRYNEITAGSIWYEHSVLYVDEGDRGTIRIIEDQNLLTNRSNALRLTAVQNEFEETGTHRAVIEIYPTEKITESDLPAGELDITIPTRLNKSEYWGEQLGSDVDVTEDYYDTSVHRLDLSSLSISSNNFKFNTVGIREKPEADQPKQNVGPSSQRRSGSEEDRNDDTDESPTGDELSDDAVAYFDQNENGVYDESEETSYTVVDLEELDIDGTVRVAKDVTMNRGSLSGISIDAGNVIFEDSVVMKTTGGGQSINFDSSNEIRLNNGEIKTEGGGSDITLDAGTELNANGARVEGSGGGSTIKLTSSGDMSVNSADIRSARTITIDPDGQLSAEGASIEGTGGGSTVKLVSDGDMNIDSADIRSAQTVTIDSNGQLSAESVSIEGRGGGSNIKLVSDGDMNIDSADIRSAQTTTIDAGGELSAVAVSIEGTGGGSTIELSSGGDMNIDSADLRSAQTITVDAGGSLSDNNANY